MARFVKKVMTLPINVIFSHLQVRNVKRRHSIFLPKILTVLLISRHPSLLPRIIFRKRQEY